MIYKTLRLFFRAFDLFFLGFSVLAGLIINKKYILLAILTLLNILTNVILKKISEMIMGKSTFWLLGKGTRPQNSKSCTYLSSKSVKYNGYGMPSGHSQSFAFIATLIALSLKDRHKNKKRLFLVFLTGIAMYMRIYAEKCHTVQQTIIGSTIGFIFANIAFKYIIPYFEEKSDIKRSDNQKL